MSGRNKKNLIGPILFLYYEESLLSSNLISKLFRFICVRFNLHLCTKGDLTPIILTSSNLVLNFNFYIIADSGSTYMSNILQNNVELCTNLRFCHQAPSKNVETENLKAKKPFV